jgi:hypothetical protein
MKMTKSQAEAKVYELTETLLSTKRDQKDVNAGYKEKIKDIEEEIRAIIEEYNSASTVAAPTTKP